MFFRKGVASSLLLLALSSLLFSGCPTHLKRSSPQHQPPLATKAKQSQSPFARQYNFSAQSVLSPVRGPRYAPLQIVELLNPLSSQSRQINLLRDKIWKKFPGMLRWTVRFNPSLESDRGYWYSRALYASYRSGIFWSYLKQFYRKTERYSHQALLQMAAQSGADPQAFELKLLYAPYKMLLDRDMRWNRAIQQASQSRLFVNGALLEPPYTEERVYRAFAWARARAFHMIGQGISPQHIYRKWTQHGQKLKAPHHTPHAIKKRRYIHVPFEFLEAIPTRGPGDAAIQIVEFSDFTCRPCRKAYFSLHKLLQRYPNQLRFYFKYFPIGVHRESYRSAELAAAAQDQRKFWKLYDILFREQSRIFSGDLLALARKAGMDARWISGELDRNSYRRRVRINQHHGRRLRIRAVPTIIMDGRMIFGAANPNTLLRTAKEELWKAGRVHQSSKNNKP